MTLEICIDCSRFTEAYGLTNENETICYACCAKRDMQYMRDNNRITLYLDTNKKEVTNWPGTLTFPIKIKEGRHNLCRFRYDVWFNFEGYTWHGVTYGNDTQLCHCKRHGK